MLLDIAYKERLAFRVVRQGIIQEQSLVLLCGEKLFKSLFVGNVLRSASLAQIKIPALLALLDSILTPMAIVFQAALTPPVIINLLLANA